jgi:glucokinase
LEAAAGVSTRQLIERAKIGDPFAVSCLARAGTQTGLALASLAHVFAPKMIVVGGGVAAAGDLLIAPMRNAFFRHCAPWFADGVRIEAALLGNDAGLVGAAGKLFAGKD